MDHESVHEALEIAAAEPGGLDRLMAGDTPTAMAVAAHLVGCPDCTLELERRGRRPRISLRSAPGGARRWAGSRPSPPRS
jgi:hypothetical protein